MNDDVERYLAVAPYSGDFADLAQTRAYEEEYDFCYALLDSDVFDFEDDALVDDTGLVREHFDIIYELESVLDDEEFYKDVSAGADSVFIEGREDEMTERVVDGFERHGIDVLLRTNFLETYEEDADLFVDYSGGPLGTGRRIYDRFRDLF